MALLLVAEKWEKMKPEKDLGLLSISQEKKFFWEKIVISRGCKEKTVVAFGLTGGKLGVNIFMRKKGSNIFAIPRCIFPGFPET